MKKLWTFSTMPPPFSPQHVGVSRNPNFSGQNKIVDILLLPSDKGHLPFRLLLVLSVVLSLHVLTHLLVLGQTWPPIG